MIKYENSGINPRLKIIIIGTNYFKITIYVIGDGGVGKTVLLSSYTGKELPENHIPTGKSNII